ncbi:MAG: class I SAM-dependent methyltransferase [Anaerolineae bacterium]|nr:class I SAM-dependent methyltransferase [Anaerolineae bacterium]
MVIYEIQSDIKAIEKNAALYEETNFDSRTEALDYLEFNVIDRIEGLLQTINPPEELVTLKQDAERVKRQLEDVDDTLFQRLRADIRGGGCIGTALRDRIDEYVGRDVSGSRGQDEIGYDSLDLFVNGLLLSQAVPPETKAREPEMVAYQQTPARIIFELVEQAHLTREDVFYDVGSGLGQVPILVHLLTGAAAKGIEFEPAYCDYARACAAELNLSGVEFVNADARTADYSHGTAFFMYTPFEGSILQDVLEKLRGESRRRRIRLFTYGPCTPQVSRQSWLKCLDQNGDHLYRLGVFRSL